MERAVFYDGSDPATSLSVLEPGRDTRTQEDAGEPGEFDDRRQSLGHGRPARGTSSSDSKEPHQVVAGADRRVAHHNDPQALDRVVQRVVRRWLPLLDPWADPAALAQRAAAGYRNRATLRHGSGLQRETDRCGPAITFEQQDGRKSRPGRPRTSRAMEAPIVSTVPLERSRPSAPATTARSPASIDACASRSWPRSISTCAPCLGADPVGDVQPDRAEERLAGRAPQREFVHEQRVGSVVERHDLDVLQRSAAGEREPVVLPDIGGKIRRPQVVVGLALPRDALVFARQPRDVLVHEEIAALAVLDVGERRCGGEEVGEPGLRRFRRSLRPHLGRHVIRHDDVPLGRPRAADRRRCQA